MGRENTAISGETERGRVTRERIVEAAFLEFADRGFEGTSTHRIARRAGVKQPLIHYHFTTKDRLWQAAADLAFARVDEALDRHLDGSSEKDPARFVEAFVRTMVECSGMLMFMQHESRFATERVAWIVDAHVRPIFEQVIPQLESAQAEGLLPAGNSLQLVYTIIGASMTMHTLASEVSLQSGHKPEDPEWIETHIDLVLALLRRDRREA